MTWFIQARLRAALLFLVPVVGLVGVAVGPYITDLGDNEEIAEEVAAGVNRFAWSQLILVVALGLTFLAFFALRTYLRLHGEDFWSLIAVPLMVIGGSMLAFAVGGTAIGAWVTDDTGGSMLGFFESADGWVLGMQATGGLIAVAGVLALAVAIGKSKILSMPLTWAVIIGLVLTFVNVVAAIGTLAYYIAGAGELVAYWILGSKIWTDAKEELVHPVPAELRITVS